MARGSHIFNRFRYAPQTSLFWFRLRHADEQFPVAGKLTGFSPLLAFSLGVMLGAPGHGFAERLGLPHLPEQFTIATSDGFVAPVAAALIVHAVLNCAFLDKVLSSGVPQYLGRVSFPLYLVQVPPHYTIFAS